MAFEVNAVPGSLSAAGYAKETTYGTAVTATKFVPFTSITPEQDPGFFSPKTMVGVRDAQIFPLFGEQKDTITLEAPLFPTNGIEFLVYALGSDAVTGSGPYIHTVTEATVLSSLTVESNLGSKQSLQFAGSRVNKWSLKLASGDEEASFSADIIAQNAAVLDSPTAVSFINEDPFVFAEATVSMFGSQIYCSDVSLDLDNALNTAYTMQNQHYLTFLTPTTLTVSGEATLVFDSLDDSTYGYYDKTQGGTTGALQIQLRHPTGTEYGVTLNCPLVLLSKYGDDIKIDDVIYSNVTWQALYNTAGTGDTLSTIYAVITNGVSTQY